MNGPCATSELHRQLGLSLGGGDHTFRLPGTKHAIMARQLPTRHCHISNNDHGLKPILFDIEGARDFVLDGDGAAFDCRGPVLPIRIGNSRNIIIRNLTIDWLRPSFTPATVVDAADGRLEFVCDPDEFPLAVHDDRLVACDPHDAHTGRLWNLLPFDAQRGEVSSTVENWHLGGAHTAHQVAPGRFLLEAAFPEVYAPGTPIVLMHGDRVAPGIWIENSQDVVIENVTIHHAPGMGVIAQRSRNITIDGLRVVPSGKRLFSTWVDAVHMTDCDGATLVRNCELRGQFDDAVNLHARFSLMGARTGRCSALIHTIHPQHAGSSPATPGCGWAFYRRTTLELASVTRVKSVRQIDPTTAEVAWDDPLPEAGEEWVGARFDPDSTVEIRGCLFGANRGRGVLINLEHHAAVEHNHFHVSGRAVESIPDANYWWEGSPVRDLVIRGNTFDNCCYGPCGDDLMYFGPELPDGSDPRGNPLRATDHAAAPCTTPVMRNITVEQNTIIRHRGRALHAHGVDGLVFRQNTIRDASRHPGSDPASLIDLGPGMGRTDIDAEGSCLKSAR